MNTHLMDAYFSIGKQMRHMEKEKLTQSALYGRLIQVSAFIWTAMSEDEKRIVKERVSESHQV